MLIKKHAVKNVTCSGRRWVQRRGTTPVCSTLHRETGQVSWDWSAALCLATPCNGSETRSVFHLLACRRLQPATHY